MPTEAEILEKCPYLRPPSDPSRNVFFCRLSEELARMKPRGGYMCDNGLCTSHCGIPQRLTDTGSTADPLTDLWFREMVRGMRKSILVSYYAPPPGLDALAPDFDYEANFVELVDMVIEDDPTRRGRDLLADIMERAVGHPSGPPAAEADRLFDRHVVTREWDLG